MSNPGLSDAMEAVLLFVWTQSLKRILSEWFVLQSGTSHLQLCVEFAKVKPECMVTLLGESTVCQQALLLAASFRFLSPTLLGTDPCVEHCLLNGHCRQRGAGFGRSYRDKTGPFVPKFRIRGSQC